jgi:hypothetical protein
VIVGLIQHAPSDVIRWAIIHFGDGTDPTLSPLQAWPVYDDIEPPTPDNCVSVFSTTPEPGQRNMVSGDYPFHYGFMVRVRAQTSSGALLKIKTIETRLSQQLYDQVITIGGVNYVIHSVSIKSGPLRSGLDSPSTKRSIYTLNCTAYIQPYPVVN